MRKKIVMFGAGVATVAASFAAVAMIANADTVTATNVASIAVSSPTTTIMAVPPSPNPVPSSACPVFSRSLFVGATGNDVTMLQDYLNAHGYLAVSATGYFGPLTEAAVARWQAQGNVVTIGGYGSGTFGPLSRAYFLRSCTSTGPSGTNGSSTTQALSFTANPSSGAAPLTVQFTASAPQGTTMGNFVNFGDGTTGTLGYVPTCSSCNAMAIGAHTYASAGTYTVSLLTNGACACPANGICNCPASIILATTTVTVTTGDSSGSGGGSGGTSSTTEIVQLDAPGSATINVSGIVEVRNASFYFTLASITGSSATIDPTPVGCWNSFPSDQPPAVRCMIAVVPIPPQTLSVGQSYEFANRTITLTSMSGDTATFEIE